MTKPAILIVALVLVALAEMPAKHAVDMYSPKDLADRTAALAAKRTPFAGEDLVHYGNHYTMMAYRSSTGSAEVHEHEADIFIIESGAGTLLKGGKLVSPKTTKPGEIRGSSITGGERLAVATGAVIHIPAGVPHQLLIDAGKPVSYFVVKVTGQ